jgi:radical SAM superfamily enzyme YgiQ (UPF0313 family)
MNQDPNYSGKKKKLLLISPINRSIISVGGGKFTAFPPLGLGILATMTPTEFFDVKIVDENIEKVTFEDADLVGVSAFSCVAKRAYEIAAYYRGRNIPVIMGGIHASMRTEEALQYVDCVVVGEAESVWDEVINDFLKGNLKQVYRGVHLPLENMVVPKRKLFSNKYMFGSLITTRGCPMACSFCSVTTFNGGEFRQRPVNEVLDELATLPQKLIFFADDNIAGYGKKSEDRAIEIFKGMVERKMNKWWVCMASVNMGHNEELLYWAKKSGCLLIYLGLETEDPKELEEMNKKLNQKLSYQVAFENINKHGIGVFGAFIFGGINETKESIRRRTDYIINNRISAVQVTLMTALPGTILYQQLEKENKLLYTDFPTDWDRYNMGEITIKYDRISEAEMWEALKENFGRLFSIKTFIKKFFQTLKNTRNLTVAFISFVYSFTFRKFAFELVRDGMKRTKSRNLTLGGSHKIAS